MKEWFKDRANEAIVEERSPAEEITELKEITLQTISSIDFLKTSQNKRLKYITLWNIDSSRLITWEVKSLDFDFKWNKELYLKTTAGQVMPAEVRSIITPDWLIWKRSSNNLLWEFFDKNNKRLIIWDSSWVWFKWYSKIEGVILWDINTLTSNISTKFKAYSEKQENKDNFDIIKASLERWIDPELAIRVIWNELNLVQKNERSSKIEYILTAFLKVRWDYWLSELEINWFLETYILQKKNENKVEKSKISILIQKYFKFPEDIKDQKIREALLIIWEESGFNSNDVRPFWENSRWNDIWLFQINDFYQRENISRLGYARDDMFNIEKNIAVAALAYNEWWKTWKSWVAAIKLWLA